MESGSKDWLIGMIVDESWVDDFLLAMVPTFLYTCSINTDKHFSLSNVQHHARLNDCLVLVRSRTQSRASQMPSRRSLVRMRCPAGETLYGPRYARVVSANSTAVAPRGCWIVEKSTDMICKIFRTDSDVAYSPRTTLAIKAWFG